MENGLFITLRDERSLALYLQEGVFSQHQKPQMDNDVHHSSNHYKVLADYACARPGTHVFFFRERRIYYGGQVVSGADDENVGAFYINGQTSPMGRRADADLGWDEGQRDDYDETNTEGIFEVPTSDGNRTATQPFLLRFDTDVKYGCKHIRSDDLYFDLGDYPYPLKSNTIRGVGFCPMGPGETKRLLEQIERAEETYNPEDGSIDVPDVTLNESKVVPFQPDLGISNVKRKNLTSEAHLEASVIANPSLLPDELAPGNDRAIVRQAPISPLKPMQIDHIDICYYDPQFENGMYPNGVVELKYTEADDAEQIQRYREATDKMAEHHLSVEPDDIDVGMFAPLYDEDHFGAFLDPDLRQRIDFRQFEQSPEVPNFVTRIDSY